METLGRWSICSVNIFSVDLLRGRGKWIQLIQSNCNQSQRLETKDLNADNLTNY